MAKEYKELSEQVGKSPFYTKGAELMIGFAEMLHKQGLLPESLEALKESKKPTESREVEVDELLEMRIQSYKLANTYRDLSGGLVCEFWQTAWEQWGDKIGMGLKIEVPGTHDLPQAPVLNTREMASDPPFYVPDLTLDQLTGIFPSLGTVDLSGISISNSFGWRFGEASLQAPNLDTTPRSLDAKFLDQEREGMDLREYIILSQFTKLTRGYYLDEMHTSSRLLGSVKEKYPVIAKFSPSGILSLHQLNYRGDNSEMVGGRSTESV